MKKSQWPATSEDGMSYTGADGLARLVDMVDYLGWYLGQAMWRWLLSLATVLSRHSLAVHTTQCADAGVSIGPSCLAERGNGE